MTFLLVNKQTNEIERAESNRFFYDEEKYNLIDTPFYELNNGKLYYINGEIIKEPI